MPRLILNHGIYPCWRHNRDGESMVVNTKEHDDALGDDWADTPMAFEAPEPVETEKIGDIGPEGDLAPIVVKVRRPRGPNKVKK